MTLISKYSTMSSCLILGDMNAHTNVNQDFINGDERNNLLQLPES